MLQFCVLRKELCKSSIRIQAQKIDIHSEVMLVVAWWQCPGLMVWRWWEQVATPGSIVLVFPAPGPAQRRSGDRWSACPMLTGAPSVWGGVSGPGAGRGGGGLRTPTLAGRWSRVPGWVRTLHHVLYISMSVRSVEWGQQDTGTVAAQLSDQSCSVSPPSSTGCPPPRPSQP